MIGQSLSKLKKANTVLWSLDVGRMHSRNNVIVQKDSAFVSTSGETWNTPDRRDGVYRIDLTSKATTWFAPTFSDANEISLINDIVFVGTDSGKALAFNANTGAIVSEIAIEDPIYSRAFELESPFGRSAILISISGKVVQYNFEAKAFSVIGTLPYRVRANPTRIAADSFLVGSETGIVALAQIKNGDVIAKEIFRIEPHKASGHFNFELQIVGISSIVAMGDRVIVSYARNTYDRRPPMACFSLRTGKKIWDAGRIQTASKSNIPEFGNSRVTPTIWRNLLISTFAYNDAVHAFSLDTGKWIWRQRLDDSYFQNWSSPIAIGDLLYVARINGVVTVVDLKTRKILSTYSVEVFDEMPTNDVSRSIDDQHPWPNNRFEIAKGPGPAQVLLAGICSTPAVWDDKILIGTVSGKFCVLEDGSKPAG